MSLTRSAQRDSLGVILSTLQTISIDLAGVASQKLGFTLESKGACTIPGPGAKCGVRGAVREVGVGV